MMLTCRLHNFITVISMQVHTNDHQQQHRNYVLCINSRAIQYERENLPAFTINLVLLKCEEDDLFSFIGSSVVGGSVCVLLMYVPGSW